MAGYWLARLRIDWTGDGLILGDTMSGDPETHELVRQLAAPEERMDTHEAEYRTDIARLAEDNAERETWLIVIIAGLMVGIVGTGVAFLALLIGFPG